MGLKVVHMKKNIAVVGSGYWGKNLVRNFHELNALKTICDLDEDVLTQFQSQYPGVETTQSFQKILDDDQIEGIIIATPAALHFKMAKEALNHGKDVFVEKPLSLHIEDGKIG